jgi:fluoride exporter
MHALRPACTITGHETWDDGMRQWLAIAAGGAIGALLRYWVSTGTHALLGRGFPYGTFTVNVLGSLLMGFLYVWLLDRVVTGPVVRAFLLIGLLGGFTTFSSFSIESLNLIEAGQLFKALANVLLSVTLCIAAAGLGVLIARQL